MADIDISSHAFTEEERERAFKIMKLLSHVFGYIVSYKTAEKYEDGRLSTEAASHCIEVVQQLNDGIVELFPNPIKMIEELQAFALMFGVGIDVQVIDASKIAHA